MHTGPRNFLASSRDSNWIDEAMTHDLTSLLSTLRELEGLGKEATEGEWKAHHAESSDFITTISADGVDGCAYTSCGDKDRQNADADFIVGAHNSLPAIAKAVWLLEKMPKIVEEAYAAGFGSADSGAPYLVNTYVARRMADLAALLQEGEKT